MKKMNNCKCGSDRILRCEDHTVFPYKYWIECMDCGFIGGIVYSNQRFSMATILQDGRKIFKSPENESIDLWNIEMNNNN